MKLIVGLGNPGLLYKKTRHNLGFVVLDEFVKEKNLKFNKKKFNGIYLETNINNEKVIFLKPQKYMNLSGEVVRSYVNFFNISIDNIVVVADDLDTNIGQIKIKSKGSSGGHNGLKNIADNLKTDNYKRIKIGIRNNDFNKKDVVLGKFTKDEKDQINLAIENAKNAISDYFNLSFENLMNKYNK